MSKGQELEHTAGTWPLESRRWLLPAELPLGATSSISSVCLTQVHQSECSTSADTETSRTGDVPQTRLADSDAEKDSGPATTWRKQTILKVLSPAVPDSPFQRLF